MKPIRTFSRGAPFPIERVKFNPPNSWPENHIPHDSVMEHILKTDPNDILIPRYHFHPNEDGTLTPLSRACEIALAVAKVAGVKTFLLV